MSDKEPMSDQTRLELIELAKKRLVEAREIFYERIDRINAQLEKLDNVKYGLKNSPAEEDRSDALIQTARARLMVPEDIDQDELDETMARHPAGSKQKRDS